MVLLRLVTGLTIISAQNCTSSAAPGYLCRSAASIKSISAPAALPSALLIRGGKKTTLNYIVYGNRTSLLSDHKISGECLEQDTISENLC